MQFMKSNIETCLSQPDAPQPVDGPASALPSIRARLELEKRRIFEEIKNYPRPIAGCDQHFNRLLELRNRICQELDRLAESTKPLTEKPPTVGLA